MERRESPCTVLRLAHLQPHFSGQRLQHRAAVVFLLEALHSSRLRAFFEEFTTSPFVKNLMLLHVLQHFLILHFLAWQLRLSLVFWVDFGVKLKIWCKWVLLSASSWSWPNFLACFPPSFLDSQCFLCHRKAGLDEIKMMKRYFGDFFILGKPVWKMLADIFLLLRHLNFRLKKTSNLVILVSTSWTGGKQGIFLLLECFLSFRSNVKSWWWEDWK